MNRDFTYRGLPFHLNDNGSPNSPRREFEGKYVLLFWDVAYDSWRSAGTVSSKKEALERARFLYKDKRYPYCYMRKG